MEIKYLALIGNGKNPQSGDLVAEIFAEPTLFVDGNYYSLSQMYTSELLSWLKPCPAGTQQNAVATLQEDGTWTYVNPAVPPVTVPNVSADPAEDQ